MYKPVDTNVDFCKQEEEVLAFWEKAKIFQQSVSQRTKGQEFVFYDGPPFATGLPHYGHFLANVIKDVIPRYQTMQGKQVKRRFGWDCHGLPVECEAEKELGISGRGAIEKLGVAAFNETCRSIVLRYASQWRQAIKRLGRWVDFDDDYKTMDLDYMESIWWVVRALWEKDLIYEGHYILPYCPRCSTVLSNHELSQGGYEEVTDPAITVFFPLLEDPETSFLAWTTTPWTLTSNLALAVGPEISYVKVTDQDTLRTVILSEKALTRYYADPSQYAILARYKGSDLAGITYKPPFDYFKELQEKGAFRVIAADYVLDDEGVGIVHVAPGFGEEDYEALKGSGIPTVVPIDDECRFIEPVSEYKGLFVKESDSRIISDLQRRGLLFKNETYLHPYPHCWRCQAPLIYRAINSWFVRVEKIKKAMVEANRQIRWVPSHLKEGRFGKWLADARDWAISRNRFWGNPLPIWRCEGCGEEECFGSRAQLEEKSGQRIEDLHKQHVDRLTFPCQKCCAEMKRVPEVLDCWFESGAMPYAQNHYPFENKEHFHTHFPADFIAEGLDQTRGWFYTLTVLAAGLFEKPAFSNVIVNGIVLAADGKKMSKSMRNYTDPSLALSRFGADALRLFLMDSPAVRAVNLCFEEEEVRTRHKSFLIPLWNAYSFFVTYANLGQMEVREELAQRPNNPLDRWILSESLALVQNVTEGLETYQIQKASEPLTQFVELLNNWYIRCSRRRFWRSENDADKVDAYRTLYTVLMRFITVAAPLVPFVTEAIYQNLRHPEGIRSIHLLFFPQVDDASREPELEKKMALTRKVVTMGRGLRRVHKIKTRQPLSLLQVATEDAGDRAILSDLADLIRQELNVHKIEFIYDEEPLVKYEAKANYRVLGKILGKEMKKAASLISDFSQEQIKKILSGDSLSLSCKETCIQLTQEHILIQRRPRKGLQLVSEEGITVAFVTEITPKLRREGLARELVRTVQMLRKQEGLGIADHIRLRCFGDDELAEVVREHGAYVRGETLSDELLWSSEGGVSSLTVGEKPCFIGLEKLS